MCYHCGLISCSDGQVPHVQQCGKPGTDTKPDCVGGCSPGFRRETTARGNSLSCTSLQATNEFTDCSSLTSKCAAEGTSCQVTERFDCRPCSPGLFSPDYNADNCTACAPGAIADEGGARKCAPLRGSHFGARCLFLHLDAGCGRVLAVGAAECRWNLGIDLFRPHVNIRFQRLHQQL